MRWLILIIVGILAIALVVFLIIRNQKDEKEFETELNNDFTKRKSEDDNTDLNF